MRHGLTRIPILAPLALAGLVGGAALLLHPAKTGPVYEASMRPMHFPAVPLAPRHYWAGHYVLGAGEPVPRYGLLTKRGPVDLGALRNGDELRGEFRRAKWAGVNLSGLTFTAADFRAANLTGADLRNACLWQCNLRKARLDGADLTGARYDRFTVWPEGFNPTRAGAILDE